ncbi:MAG: homocysteine S-methyltransferase family protein [Acidobacteriota bacterium]
MPGKGILDRLKEGVVLGDGGYLLELERRGWVRAGPFTPEVILKRPEAVRELHAEFHAAGSEVLQALTFYASRDKLATVGLQDSLPDLNRAAVRIARQVAGEDRLVAGTLTLTWMYEEGSAAARDKVRASYEEQLALQVEEGIDFVIGETFSWLGEAVIAVREARKTGLPVMATMSFDLKPMSWDGKGPAECAKTLVDEGADIVGINCLRNPEHTLPLIEEVRRAVSGYVACQPTGYRTPADDPDFTHLPQFPTEVDTLQLSRREMASFAVKARELGVNFIGACCGVAATHLREMARALGKLPPDSQPWRIDYDRPMSSYEYYGHGKSSD